MNVYGVDFTSNPSPLRSKAQSAKWMYLATCELNDATLVVTSLSRLNGDKQGDYSKLANLLSKDGSWIAGIDVPFGMPIECIEYFNWFESEATEQSWTTYVTHVRRTADRRAFRGLIESWRHPDKSNSSGEQERVRKYRIVDKRINSQSPMNCIRPAVGSMFFEACAVLRATSACIPPVRWVADEKRHIVETYPRLVVNRLIGSKAYKEADDLDGVRREIMARLIDTNADSTIRKSYGFTVTAEQAISDECVEDSDGDKLDSILCAVQAAWASGQKSFGIPAFASSVMNSIVALEGWVPDPSLEAWTRRIA